MAPHLKILSEDHINIHSTCLSHVIGVVEPHKKKINRQKALLLSAYLSSIIDVPDSVLSCVAPLITIFIITGASFDTEPAEPPKKKIHTS